MMHDNKEQSSLP